MKTLKWSNLKNNRCPACGRDLAGMGVTWANGNIVCMCKFKIRENRMSEIVREMNRKDLIKDRYAKKMRDMQPTLF